MCDTGKCKYENSSGDCEAPENKASLREYCVRRYPDNAWCVLNENDDISERTEPEVTQLEPITKT